MGDTDQFVHFPLKLVNFPVDGEQPESISLNMNFLDINFFTRNLEC